MFDAHAQKMLAYYSNIIVMLQIFDNLFHYKNILTVQWIKRLKLCMVTMVTLPPAKELKIQVVSWQNEIRTLDVLQSPTCGKSDVPCHKELLLKERIRSLWEQILFFKRRSHFENGSYCKKLMLDTVVSL